MNTDLHRPIVRGAITLFVLAISSAAAASAEWDPELIRRENAREGSRDWQLTRVALLSNTSVRAAYIEGYCSKQSVQAGESLDIHVSTKTA